MPDWYEGAYAVCFTVFSVAIMFLILAYFLRFAHSGRSVLDPMQADAYGMFLVHYPIALWLQYWLFDFNMPATVKAPVGIRVDGRVQLGADARAAQDSGREESAVKRLTPSCPEAMRSIEPGISQIAAGCNVHALILIAFGAIRQ